MRMTKIGDVHVVTVYTWTCARDIAATMARNDVAVVVVMSGHEPIGTITERDLVRHVLRAGYDARFCYASDILCARLVKAVLSDRGMRPLGRSWQATTDMVPWFDAQGEVLGTLPLDELKRRALGKRGSHRGKELLLGGG